MEPVPEAPGTMSFRQALAVVRRRFQLILVVTACGAALGLFLASREPTTYKASAMLRLAGERQTLTGVAEEAAPSLGRTADPMLSIIELLRSRTVAGVAVDSLGLQLVSLTPDFSVEDLAGVKVDPRAAGDSVAPGLPSDVVSARRGERAVTAPYGQLINLGVVQFVVRSRPAVETVSLGIRSRESAIDGLLGRAAGDATGADRRDRRRLHRPDPRTAQRIVNSTVQAFQTLNVQWARERSRRRGEFLAEQLAQTDSMLELAQAELSSFRSRAAARRAHGTSSGGTVRPDRARCPPPELDADRQTFGALLQRLKSSDEGSREEALRALATSPAMADNPAIGGPLSAAPEVPERIDSMTTGPWRSSPNNPDLIQIRALANTTQQQLVQVGERPHRRARGPGRGAGLAAGPHRCVHVAPARDGRRGNAAQPASRRARQHERRAPR